MPTFEELAKRSDDDIDVALGAALIARDVYPNLDVEGLLAKFDELAEGLEPLGDASAAEQAKRLSHHVYVALGFHGNETEYYDPRNSLLPDVLGRRTGIPISLALVYAEIARRRGVQTRGISFPGHFLVRIESPHAEGAPIYVDPFFSGRVLGVPDLKSLLGRVAGQAGIAARTETLLDLYKHLAPATGRAILQRWLMNLRGIYLQRGDHARALLVLDRLVSLSPALAWPLRERGLLAARLGAIEAARADLERALALCGDAKNDADQIRGELHRLAPRKRSLN
jgi:regulator of sirC expression with transglutaminase-like and TPR domain